MLTDALNKGGISPRQKVEVAEALYAASYREYYRVWVKEGTVLVLQGLANDLAPEVRTVAFHRLFTLDRENLSGLIGLIKKDPSVMVREEAVSNLGVVFRETYRESGELAREASQALIAALDDSSGNVRQRAVGVISIYLDDFDEGQQKEATQKMVPLLSNDPAKEVRRAIAHIDHPAIKSVLLRLKDSPDMRIREFALENLIDHHRCRDNAAMVDALNDIRIATGGPLVNFELGEGMQAPLGLPWIYVGPGSPDPEDKKSRFD